MLEDVAPFFLLIPLESHIHASTLIEYEAIINHLLRRTFSVLSVLGAGPRLNRAKRNP